MIIDDFIENYGDLEDYLKLFHDSNIFKLKPDGLKANIYIKSINETLKLSEKDLNELCLGNRLKKRGLTYLRHCGYTYNRYGEISISVFHPKYTFIDDAREWRANPLKFKIANKLFDIGPASPLFVLLNEPIYRDSDWQYDFHNFATIKVINTDKNEIKDDVIKALYYLNSHYLKTIGFAARVYQMELSEDDPLNLWENNIDDIFKKVNRIRTRSRDNFISKEPLILYNHAQSINGDEKFLYLYRILEFFIQRAKIRKLSDLRFDTAISDLILLNSIELKNEEMLLDNLINETLNNNQKKVMSKYAHHKGLIKEINFMYLTKALYKFRNSIVHAKENQINSTKIPNPFELNHDVHPWIYIIDEVAIRCIRKYNKASN